MANEEKGGGKRVLVCGGRDFDDYDRLAVVLGELRSRWSFAVVITGGARGADGLASEWAIAGDIPIAEFRADWQRLGPGAGPIRNQRMLDEGKPDLVVAFPGGRGTADMVRRAKAAGVEVIEVPRG